MDYNFKRLLLRSTLLLILLFLSIISVLFYQNNLAPKAKSAKIYLKINPAMSKGALITNWGSFAQGGEEPPPMLNNTGEKMKNLKPQYIRLDHIYDFYNVVSETSGKIVYDFSLLDQTVNDILKTGAKPFFSLSYMPSLISSSSPISPPKDWQLWKDLIKETILHYSGKSNINLTDVYYEVWNEPELEQFGSWTLSGENNYTTLYYFAQLGALQAENTNRFFFGGPAQGSYYPIFLKGFFSFIEQNNLRIDFVSWHRYTKDPNKFLEDANSILTVMNEYSKTRNLELILSEWGIDSEKTPVNNSNEAASFTIASSSLFPEFLKHAFAFEVKDGPPPQGGNWGLFTHEKNHNPLFPKPKYFAFEILSRLEGERVNSESESKRIWSIAGKKDGKIKIAAANYSHKNKRDETLTLQIAPLENRLYSLSIFNPLEGILDTFQIPVSQGILEKDFTLEKDGIIYFELAGEGDITKSNLPANGFYNLLDNTELLTFAFPQFRLLPKGGITFDIIFGEKFNPDITNAIFDIPYQNDGKNINSLRLYTQKIGQETFLIFANLDNLNNFKIKIPVTIDDSPHAVQCFWNPDNIILSFDGIMDRSVSTADIRNSQILRFYPNDALLKNLKVYAGSQIIISK